MTNTEAQQQTRPAQSALGAWLGGNSARFYICVGVLLAAALSMETIAAAIGGVLRKQPVELQKPFYALDHDRLLPEYEPHPVQPPPLSEDLVENLGTHEYLQIYLTDRTVPPADSLVARVGLFVTYYTGQPDMVPHNPKECNQAAGMLLQGEQVVDIEVPKPGANDVTIPVRMVTFQWPQGGRMMGGDASGEAPEKVVAFFFYANGKYVNTRTGVRTATQWLFDKYAFYAKIELSFSNSSMHRFANEEETAEASTRLLRKLMPILWEEHFQDWEALNGTRDSASEQAN